MDGLVDNWRLVGAHHITGSETRSISLIINNQVEVQTSLIQNDFKIQSKSTNQHQGIPQPTRYQEVKKLASCWQQIMSMHHLTST